jgi:hypothetical protein
MTEGKRTRPRIHVVVPQHTAQSLRAGSAGSGIDVLVAGLKPQKMRDPELEELHTTVSDTSRDALKRAASVLGMPEGTVLWLLDEFGHDHVNELCRRRCPKPN